MRQDISFKSHGQTCRGWFYSGKGPKAPGIVMSHGLTAVKSFYLDTYAQAFAKAGFAVTVFDYRCLGESEGSPRGSVVPHDQHDDLRAALTWMSQAPGVDKDRIGLWGTSFSGGHTMYVGALDLRVKAIVAQVPAIDILGSLIMMNGIEGVRGLFAMLQADLDARNAGAAGQKIPVVAPAGQPSLMPRDDAFHWFSDAAKRFGGGWVNELPLGNMGSIAEYKPAAFIDLIAPRPLLIQAARHDSLIPLAQIEAAFARAGEGKRLDVFDCGHFDLYADGPLHRQAVDGAIAWFEAGL